MHPDNKLNRRQFNAGLSTALTSGCVTSFLASAIPASPTMAEEPTSPDFRLNYLLASCLYGHIFVGDILPEAAKTGATAIDLWPRVHGSQREQFDVIGEARFAEMLDQYQLSIGCLTRYDLAGEEQTGQLQNEIRLAGRIGCPVVVTAGKGPVGLRGDELKSAVKNYVEQQQPTIELAAENGVRLAIENHAKSLIDSADSMRWLAELSAEVSPDPGLAIAFAPYHLPQNPVMLGELIRQLGPSIALFYAWEHGMGCMEKLPKEQELMQLPGRGSLDFKPLLAALREIGFNGWTEIFMHPVPRGIPIMENEALVSEQIVTAKRYLENLIAELK